MDFDLSNDHQMLSDMLRRFFIDNYPIERRSDTAFAAPYHCPQTWNALAELGVTGAFATEESGGFGGTPEDVMVVFEEVGRGLCAEPILGSLLGIALLEALGQTELLEPLISGEQRAALAIFEPGVTSDLDALTTVADKSGDGWVLTGRKSSIYGATGAQTLLVAAKSPDGIGLFSVSPDLLIEAGANDGGSIGELIMDQAKAVCLATDAREDIENALDLGRIALCAEAVGAMDRLIEDLVAYLGERKQFGRPLAKFQALQHRVVDLVADAQMARSITIRAVASFGTPDQARHVAMAKNLVGRAAVKIGEDAIQLHGGIGMTWEHAGSHYAKRLILMDHQLGDRTDHALRLMQMARADAA